MTYVHQIIIADNNNVMQNLPSATDTVKQTFSKYKYSIWLDSDIRKMLADLDPKILWAYDKLRPYAYKADLARYCILYIYGGWYVDINLQAINTPPKEDEFDMILFRDYNNGTRMAPWQLANGLIYAKPGLEIFKILINKIVKHCEDEYYGRRTLSVTGPELFGWAVAMYGWDNDNSTYLIGDFVDSDRHNRKVFVVNGKEFMLHKKLNGGQVGVKGTNDYVKMWHAKDVYNEL